MEREYVGIDLHRRRSVIVRRTREGDVLSAVRLDSDPLVIAAGIAQAGPNPR